MDSNTAGIVVLIVCAGLVNWLVTFILVEGVIFHGFREGVKRRCKQFTGRCKPIVDKLAYLVSCQLCAGTWIGFGMALMLPGPVHLRPTLSWLDWFYNGLLYKAVGHLFLQVNGWFHTRKELMDAEIKAMKPVSESEPNQPDLRRPHVVRAP